MIARTSILCGMILMADICQCATEHAGTYIGTEVVKVYDQATDEVSVTRSGVTFVLNGDDSFSWSGLHFNYASSGTFGAKEGIFSMTSPQIGSVLLHFKSGGTIKGTYTAGTAFGPGYQSKFTLKKQ